MGPVHRNVAGPRAATARRRHRSSPPPLVAATVSLATSGDRILAFGTGIGTPGEPGVAAELDPTTGAWTTLPDPDLAGVGGHLAATGTETIAVVHTVRPSPYRRTSARYLVAEDQWSALNPVPWVSKPCPAEVVIVRDEVVAHLCDAIAVLSGRSWVPLPSPPSGNTGDIVAAGDIGLAGGFDRSPSNGSAFDQLSLPLRVDGHLETEQYLVGGDVVDLPIGSSPANPDEPVEGDGDFQGSGSGSDIIILRVELVNGDECAVRSGPTPTDSFAPAGSAGSYLNEAGAEEVGIEPVAGGPARAAVAIPAGTGERAVVRIRPVGSLADNVASVFCPTLDDALDLARYLRPVSQG